MARPIQFPDHLLPFLFCTLALLFPSRLSAQTVTGPTRDPNALVIASKALQAIAGATTLSDVTLEATATYIAGSDEETGPATLVALGNQMSLVRLNLTNGQRREVRNGTNGGGVDPDGTQRVRALHNCWVDADWFFPALTLQALQTDPTLGAAYLGAAEWNGVAVIHLQFSHLVPGQTSDVTATIQGLSVVDLYLDPKSLLPVAVDYSTHPDNDFMRNIPVEVRFGNYRPIAGVAVPLRIQKYAQGTLTLDLAVSNATVNSGLSPALFAAPERPTGGAQ